MNVHDQPLLIALVAVQFFVHALGWAMAARLFGGGRSAEGQFAGFWLLLAVGLMLYVPAWPSGHAMRNLGDLLIVGAVALQHRGMLLYWKQRPDDGPCAALLAAAVAVLALSLAQPHGHGWRVATVCVGVALLLLATVRLVWRHGRAAMPVFAPALAGAYGVLALALLARAVQALASDGVTKIAIDAPGRSSLALVILVMFVGGVMNLAQIRLVLGRVLQSLTAQALTDALTGTFNRRGLLRSLQALHARALRRGQGHNYTVLMVDVDHFKDVNDRHGHAEGDRVLQRLAQVLLDGLRACDMVARWGGEEFCVLLPRITIADATALAERMVRRVAASGPPQVTVSIGVAEVQVPGETAEQVLQRADAALYRAKAAGRNCVVVDAPAAVHATTGAPTGASNCPSTGASTSAA